jgi:hypothetical protein
MIGEVANDVEPEASHPGATITNFYIAMTGLHLLA